MHHIQFLFRMMSEIIPENKPPTLQSADDWSTTFLGLLAQCLTVEPKDRPDASALLQVSFSV